MKRKSIWMISLILILALGCALLTACKKDEDPVTPPPPDGGGTEEEITLSLQPEELTLVVMDEVEITFFTNSTKAITWSSDKPDVASVEGGVVTALKEGVAVITAKIEDTSATCTVTVKEDGAMAKIQLDHEALTLENGDEFVLNAKVIFKLQEQQVALEWASDNTNVVTVDNGVIQAKSAGKATVTVSCTFKGKLIQECVAVTVI